jgi:serine/threonine protein phosphatase PrpC
MPTERFEPHYDAATAQSQGSRDRQEDALAVSCPQGAEFGFAVVSDGMGGHAAGDLASRIIVAEVFAELTLRGRAALAAPEDLAELLNASVQTANASLQAQIEAFPEQSGMGGTVVATSFVDGGLQWASVGDSLLYLLRDGMLKRLNDDHSMGPQIDLMAKNGMLDAEAARTHPQRNCLTSALTGKDIPELDCPPRRLELEDGDIIVLASDGLQSLADEDIASILDSLSAMESREIATALIRAVAAEGVSDQDNTSVAVIRVYQPEPEPEVAEPEVMVAPARQRRSIWSILGGLFGRPGLPATATAKQEG